ncbi:hypothetical protein B0H10DRAFT_1959488 [Mycena sp. CBHHK59/15]|nr:hypothetical protein B0H10DRAFT_1959488 [Mycena sp. CBHHK59/15]
MIRSGTRTTSWVDGWNRLEPLPPLAGPWLGSSGWMIWGPYDVCAWRACGGYLQAIRGHASVPVHVLERCPGLQKLVLRLVPSSHQVLRQEKRFGVKKTTRDATGVAWTKRRRKFDGSGATEAVAKHFPYMGGWVRGNCYAIWMPNTSCVTSTVSYSLLPNRGFEVHQSQ